MDQTGDFPITSSQGHNYIMIMCEIGGNTVSAEPMKNKTEDLLVETHQKIIERLKTGGIFPKNIFWIMKYQKNIKKQLRKME